MSERVTIDIKGQIAHVRLSRSDKLNALDMLMFAGLVEAGSRLSNEPDVRVVVLSGEGRAFCAGIDLDSLRDGGSRERTIEEIGRRDHEGMNLMQWAVMQWRRLAVPVIAAVQGVAFGAGFQLALGADMCFVSAQTKMSIMEARWGLVPDMAGMYLLRQLVRPDITAELMMSGRIFSGEEAARYGLVTRLCEDPTREALEFAGEIAHRSPDAIRAGKRLLYMRDTSCEAILHAETLEQQTLLKSSNHAEAIRAAAAKQEPNFGPPEQVQERVDASG
jgi:enoyl-CoA hydratase/carnithine racemase